MSLPSLEWLSRVGESALKAIPFFGGAVGVMTWTLDVGEKLLAGGLNYAIDKVSAIDTSAFGNATFTAVGAIGFGNAVFPLSEFITIWTAVFTAAGSVLVIRWIKSFIPTMAN